MIEHDAWDASAEADATQRTRNHRYRPQRVPPQQDSGAKTMAKEDQRITPEVRNVIIETLFNKPTPYWKLAMDRVGSSIALVVFSPLLLAIAVAIKLDSPGPVFFLQKRAGLGGQPFTLYKFRSMRTDAEAMKATLMHLNERNGPAFKMTDDPRVTRLGRILRKYSLDELPQFYNVFRGDMSLVGPRPLPVTEDAGMCTWHCMRRDLKPGITCLWQISAREDEDFDGWVRLDIQYLRNVNFWLDLKILLLTIPAVLSGKGAK